MNWEKNLMRFRLKINGLAREVDVPLATALLNALPDELGLTAAATAAVKAPAAPVMS